MSCVGHGGNQRVIENRCAFIKADIMLFQICARLVIVPFEGGFIHDGSFLKIIIRQENALRVTSPRGVLFFFVRLGGFSSLRAVALDIKGGNENTACIPAIYGYTLSYL
jgi:hypothetical protein